MRRPAALVEHSAGVIRCESGDVTVGFTTGDIVAVRHQPEARNGDIVLARIGGEVTLKRYERTGPHTVEF